MVGGSSSSSSSNDFTLPLSTILHMITVKLSPTNYLVWRHQLLPLLAYQKLSGHLDGSVPSPSKTKTVDVVTSPNPEYEKWIEADQRAFLIFQSSLTETTMAETLGLSTSCDVWQSLERAYRHDSQERMQTLKDTLRQLKKGSSTVSKYSTKFRGFCDQLAAIGHPVDEDDKVHRSFVVLGLLPRYSPPLAALCLVLPFLI